MPFDSVWQNGHVATMQSGGAAFGQVPDGAVAVTGQRIAWVGPRSKLPAGDMGPRTVVHDLEGAWITPGLIDCHTHLVFGGDRALVRRNRSGYNRRVGRHAVGEADGCGSLVAAVGNRDGVFELIARADGTVSIVVSG